MSGDERDLSRPIIVGVQTDAYPFSFKDEDGRIKGFAVDVVEAVARTMGLPFEQRIGDGDAKLIQTHRVDLLPLLAETENRRQFIEFSVPILRLESVVVVRRNDARIRRLSDLDGKRVGVGNPGTVAHEYVKSKHPGAIVDFTNISVAMRMTAQGTLDAVVLSRLSALSEIDRADLRSLYILPDHIVGFDVRRCIAVSRGDALLLARVNEGLAILHTTGEFEKIRLHWLGQYERRKFTGLEMGAYLAGLLILAVGVVALVLRRQRKLALRVIRQDDELAEQRSLLSALYENHPLATWVLAGMPYELPKLVSWNSQAAVLLGLDTDARSWQTVEQLVLAPEIEKLLGEVVSRWKTGGSTEPWETTLVSSHRILESTMVSLGRSSTGASRICVLTGDVTMRRLADQGVAQARRLQALGELVGGIAHEFNNLLTPVTATVDMMRRTYPSITGLGDDLQLIEEASRQAAELTRRLLSFGRKTDSCARPVCLAEITINCLALLRPTCDRRIEWVSEIASNLHALTLNPTDLNQILMNLIINARDALQEKLAQPRCDEWTPRITIGAREVPANEREPRPADAQRELLGWQVLTVQDNGIGMPSDVSDRIFEPFFTTKEVGQGTGIGLATVWHLVTEAGGCISVESRVGQGTEFHVMLPRWQAQPSVHLSIKAPMLASEAPKLRVLLAEDDRLLARSCLRGLLGLGHQATHTVDGIEAWQSFETGGGSSFDVLLTDVNMPRMGGFDLVRQVRKSGFRGRVVLMSGRVDSISVDDIQTLEVDYILAKPFTIDELVAAVGHGGRASIRKLPRSRCVAEHAGVSTEQPSRG